MQIYFIRHAAAVDLDREIAEDAFRYLTDEGRKHSAEVALKLKEMGAEFDLILSSPQVRAIQTAEIFSNVLNHKGNFKTAVELIGGASFGKFHQLIKRNSHKKSVACFGHSPDMSLFAANLIDAVDIKELKMNFKNCSVCKISYDEKKEMGKFEWFLKSDTLQIIKS